MRPIVQILATVSIVLSIVSGALSLFFHVGESKPFIILTSATPISFFAGILASVAIAYESLRFRTVSAQCLVALALAVATYAFGDFVIRDFASG